METVAAVIDSDLLICVYIPPSSPWMTVKTFFSEMLQECTGHLKEKLSLHNIIFAGDFNCAGFYDKLVDLFETFGFHQVIDCPTHRDGGMLDLIFTNSQMLGTRVLPVFLSDHFYIVADW